MNTFKLIDWRWQSKFPITYKWRLYYIFRRNSRNFNVPKPQPYIIIVIHNYHLVIPFIIQTMLQISGIVSVWNLETLKKYYIFYDYNFIQIYIFQDKKQYLWHKWPRVCSNCRRHNTVLSSFMIYHRVYNRSNATGATSGAGTANPSGAHEFIPCFSGVCVTQSFVKHCLYICSFSFGHYILDGLSFKCACKSFSFCRTWRISFGIGDFDRTTSGCTSKHDIVRWSPYSDFLLQVFLKLYFFFIPVVQLVVLLPFIQLTSISRISPLDLRLIVFCPTMNKYWPQPR